jgi:hypothetical protein
VHCQAHGNIYRPAQRRKKFLSRSAAVKRKFCGSAGCAPRYKYHMKIKEITESWVNNYHMGLGKERAQDQRLLEKPRQPKLKPKPKKK